MLFALNSYKRCVISRADMFCAVGVFAGITSVKSFGTNVLGIVVWFVDTINDRCMMQAIGKACEDYHQAKTSHFIA